MRLVAKIDAEMARSILLLNTIHLPISLSPYPLVP